MGSGDDKRQMQPGLNSESSLNELTRLAHKHLQNGNLQKAMEHFESAVEKSEGMDDNSVKISCYLNAGACLVSLGQYERGLSFLESAAGIIKTNGGDASAQTLEVNADVFYNTAVAEQGLQEYDRAVTNFKSCIDLYVKAGSKQQAAEGFVSLAICHKEAGDAHKEIACLTNAQRLYNELGERSHEALVYVDLAKAYLSIGRQDECKKMLGTAKMMCLRLDEPRIQGKLQSQFGLVYTSLGMFDEAIQSFERALPLVKVGKSAMSLQMEASILQNIGAAYNEKGLFSEGVIYHREAATLHGKTNNSNSEAKCLCNLAFAQTQLKDFPAAAESYSSALERAQSTCNPYLQFQACEGMGAVHYQMEQYSEAVRYFNQAILSLNDIKEDTGIARERVMEKLSDAAEALQLSKQAQKTSRSLSSPDKKLTSSGSSADEQQTTSLSRLEHQLESSSHSERVGRSPPKRVSRRLSPELNSVASTSVHNHINLESLPLPEKKGGFLPPIDPSRSPQLTTRHSPSTTADQDGMDSKTLATSSKGKGPSRKRATPSHRKGKKPHFLPQITENGRPPVQPLDSYEEQLHTYMNSYKEDGSGGSSLSSSSESSLSSEGRNQDSGDQLGASIFSRHASGRSRRKHTERNRLQKLSPHSPSTSANTTPLHSSPLVVQEGSLAIGPNAREMFTTKTRVVTSGQKRKKGRVHTEIVPRTHSGSGTPSLPRPTRPEHPNSTAGHQSKVCIIL